MLDDFFSSEFEFVLQHFCFGSDKFWTPLTSPGLDFAFVQELNFRYLRLYGCESFVFFRILISITQSVLVFEQFIDLFGGVSKLLLFSLSEPDY